MTNEELRELCIKNNWFTCGSNRQYDKLFEMNEKGKSADVLALVIWLCSDGSFDRNTIKQELEKLSEPQIIKNMGTNMSEDDYQKLRGDGEWEISEAEAKILINEEFGFEVSQIEIIYEVENFVSDGHYARKHQSFSRKPQDCATDYNYVRFNVRGWQYEMVNGDLNIYYD